jgi:MFS family permease
MNSIANAFRAFKSRNYRLYFAGQSISFTGSWIQQVAMGWLVYRMTQSAFMLGVISFTAAAPGFLISPFVGVLSEKIDRRKALFYVQCLFMLQAAILTTLVLTGTAQVWQLISLSVFLGFISGFEMTIRHTFFIDVIDDKNDIGNAIAINSAMFNGSRLVGPAIAGMIIAKSGEGICFFINTLCYAAIILSLYLMKTKKPEKHVSLHKIDYIGEIKEGYDYAFSFRPIREVIIIMCAIFFLALPFTTFMPVFARDVLKGGPASMGMLMSSMGAGALIGAVYLASRKSVVGLSRVLSAAAVIECLAIMAFCISRVMWVSMILVAIAGAGVMVFNSSVNTLLQVFSDEDKRGRVISYFIMAFTGMVPLGSLLQGLIGGRTRVVAVIFFCAAIGTAAAVIFALRINQWIKLVKPVYIKKGIIQVTPADDGIFSEK